MVRELYHHHDYDSFFFFFLEARQLCITPYFVLNLPVTVNHKNFIPYTCVCMISFFFFFFSSHLITHRLFCAFYWPSCLQGMHSRRVSFFFFSFFFVVELLLITRSHHGDPTDGRKTLKIKKITGVHSQHVSEKGRKCKREGVGGNTSALFIKAVMWPRRCYFYVLTNKQTKIRSHCSGTYTNSTHDGLFLCVPVFFLF